MMFGRRGAAARGTVDPEELDALSQTDAARRLDTIVHLSDEIVRRLVSRGRRGLTVAAVSDGVGVTTTATALARSLANRQVTTLLIDADLLAPAIARSRQVDRTGPGLAEVLRGEIDLNDALAPTQQPGLMMLHAGTVAGEGEGLIFSHDFSELVEHCLRRFQITIIDAPPANRSTAAFHIARATGYSLLVARRHASFTQDLSLFADQMRQVGAEVVGSVLTG